MPKIISKCCELVKICHINRSDQIFLSRDAVQARPLLLCGVCLSVCLSRSWIVSKPVVVSSKCFHHEVAQPFWFFHTKRHGNIPTGTPPPLTGASNAGGVGRNRDFERISGSIAFCEARSAIGADYVALRRLAST